MLSPRSMLLALGGMGLSALAAHVLLLSGEPENGTGAVLLLCMQILLLLCLVVSRPGRSGRRMAIAAASLAVALALSGVYFHGGLVLSAAAPHAMIYTTLLVLFGMSLLPGREPIVTFLARTIHGPLAPEIVSYTRRVTGVWCAFFVVQLAASALLLALAPIAWWSAFVMLFNMPLAVVLMVGERLSRRFWVENPPLETLRDFRHMPRLLRQGLKLPGMRP